MDRYIFDAEEFENLDTESDQLKELFFLYGACLGRVDGVTNTASDTQSNLFDIRNRLDQITRNWDYNPDEVSRIERYGELLEVFKSLDVFTTA
jgi:hypothetical protein